MATFDLPIPPSGTPVFNEKKTDFSEPWKRYLLQLGTALGSIVGGTEGEVQFNDNGGFGGIDNGTVGEVLTSNGASVTPSFASVPNRFDQELNTTDSVTFVDVTVTGDVTADTVDSNGYASAGTPGIDTTVTTGSLVGKTMTFQDGLLIGFA